METTRFICGAVRPADWAVSLDLKDAFLHISIHQAFQNLLQFRSRDRNFQFKVESVLPSGGESSGYLPPEALVPAHVPVRLPPQVPVQTTTGLSDTLPSPALGMPTVDPQSGKERTLPLPEVHFHRGSVRHHFRPVPPPVDNIVRTTSLLSRRHTATAKQILSWLGLVNSTAEQVPFGTLRPNVLALAMGIEDRFSIHANPTSTGFNSTRLDVLDEPERCSQGGSIGLSSSGLHFRYRFQFHRMESAHAPFKNFRELEPKRVPPQLQSLRDVGVFRCHILRQTGKSVLVDIISGVQYINRLEGTRSPHSAPGLGCCSVGVSIGTSS